MDVDDVCLHDPGHRPDYDLRLGFLWKKRITQELLSCNARLVCCPYHHSHGANFAWAMAACAVSTQAIDQLSIIRARFAPFGFVFGILNLQTLILILTRKQKCQNHDNRCRQGAEQQV